MPFPVRVATLGEIQAISVVSLGATPNNDSSFSQNTQLPALVALSLSTAPNAQPLGYVSNVLFNNAWIDNVFDPGGTDFQVMAVPSEDGTITRGITMDLGAFEFWAFTGTANAAPVTNMESPAIPPSITGALQGWSQVFPSINGDNNSCYIFCGENGPGPDNLDFYIYDADITGGAIFSAFRLPIAEGQLFPDAGAPAVTANDGTSYYYWLQIDHGSGNKPTAVQFTPNPVLGTFIQDKWQMAFDDAFLDTETNWLYGGSADGYVWFGAASASPPLWVRIAIDGSTYDIWQQLGDPDNALQGFFQSGDFLIAVGEVLGTATLFGLTFASQQSNYQIKDAIRLGCWSPCINVGYVEE